MAGQNSAFQVFSAYSVDGGITYSANLPIQITPSPVINIVDGNDFVGVSIGDSCLYSTWIDRRNTTTNLLYYNKTCVPQITGVHAFNQGLESKLYPNPTSKFVDVEAPFQSVIKAIVVRDKQGQVMVNKNLLNQKSIRVNFERFDAGLYFMEIFYEDGKKETAKIVVIAE